MSIKTEILEVISNNLPTQAAGEMAKFIKESEENKTKLAKALAELKEYKLKIDDLYTEKWALEGKIKYQNELDKREKELEEKVLNIDARERLIDMTIMETKLEMMGQREVAVENMVTKVFGHPLVSVYNNKTKPLIAENNGSPYSTGTLINETESITTKIEKE